MLVAIVRGSSNLLIVFLLFGAFAYFGWANALSKIEITNNDVTVSVFYGRFRIAWDEVRSIVINSPFIGLIGNEKRVVLSLAFAGKYKEKMIEFLNQQAQKRNIKIDRDGEPFPITHQNARVWW